MKNMFLSVMAALLLLFLGSGAAVTAQAATVRQLALKGSFRSVENDVVNWPTIYVNLTGGGKSTVLGRYTEHMTATVQNDANGVGTAVASGYIVAADGDMLTINGTGLGVPTSTPGINHIVEQYAIMGGTGRFAGASGTITVDRLVDLATGVSASGTIKGTIILP